tara:strand:+ start:2110 stop:3252 length:1143 start_codon:yes stop_codon:yes gene_type:complete
MKKKRIEFGELRIGSKAKHNLLDCVSKDWASAGPKVKEFEQKWGRIFNYKYNKALSSGTDAGINLVASLYDFGAERGDEVIIPALSFIATANAVLAAGFTPVFVDVNRETLNIDPDKIEAAITPKTRAIKVVHTMGRPCEMDPIVAIAKKHDLLLFEDSCEAHGAKYKDNYIGTFGDGATFSYYVAHLICCGEGGMISTNNEKVAESVHSTRTHGRKNGDLYFSFDRIGFNSKMNDLEASLGLEGIGDFKNTYRTRRTHLFHLMSKTKEYKKYAFFNEQPDHMEVCPHGFSIVLKDAKYDISKLCSILDDHNIHWKRNFGCTPTQHKAHEFLGYKLGDFPEAEFVGDNGIHVGVHQYLSKDDLDRMVEAFTEFFEGIDEA